MGSKLDPREHLTETLTTRPNDKMRDTFTDIASGPAFEHQNWLRVLNKVLGLEIFGTMADINENQFLSLGRESRRELVQAMYSINPDQAFSTGFQLESIVPEPLQQEEKQKKSHFWSRKKKEG